ncbi:hypothetical protein BAUCODRAFT_33929 [Baudoinia panamericana UAMH 10762]|uniref:DNA mismatch repair protein PMS1 n=1 Tax=Baudoinia panamericana (strain UAMH 10762) TaxID=717646 RepID=M2MIT3_BAUPA|nr:uncharacterized protein BAUCODRAFT_33929 [Baudoinia panamericana UAMH 10762]EMC96566.1 hypothetical protein BAUCODRAFT_33929 [Baudoinia panamericana UAMH 10762]
MATIKAIESRSIHQIQSGQVIVDLCSVVKELVENSLDAGASSIDVGFKDHGLETIEVQDNGKGIAPHDFDTVALKHYTSKLSNYEDLTSLDTFGFRGEALSSLCALSKFHIVTARAEDGAVGKRLDFEVSGKLRSATVTAAQKGTTVSVGELFYNLPVRRKELEKNIKREFGKVVAYLHAYACISVGVRFSVSNQMPKGKKVAVFSTKSNTTTKENIVNVFGTKTLVALIKLDLQLEMEPSVGPGTQSARNWTTQAANCSTTVLVQGHISKPVFGEGRQAPDRQMFFVNSRPCLLPQVSKAINEVYKSYNVSQSPFIFANLIVDTNSYDVNVSPDKRTIMLHNQTALLESLKTALTELFDQTDHTVPQSSLPNRRLPAYQTLNVPRPHSTEQSVDDEAESDSDERRSKTEPTNPTVVAHPVRTPKDETSLDTPSNLLRNWLGREADDRHEKSFTIAKRKTMDLQKETTEPVNMSQEHETNHVDSLHAKHSAQFDDPNLGADRLPACDANIPSTTNAIKCQSPHRSTIHNAGTCQVAPDPMGTPYDDLFSQRPAHLTGDLSHTHAEAAAVGLEAQSAAGDDGNHRHESDHPDTLCKVLSVQARSADQHETTPLSGQLEEESSISAIATGSQKATSGAVQSAFDRMRPKRTRLQTAEITIGDTTTTAIIGSSPPYKKRRVYAPQNSQSIAKFGASPLLARGLRTFAAPGSQLAIDSSDVPMADDAPSEHDSAGSVVDRSSNDGERTGSPTATGARTPEHDRTSDPLDELPPVGADDDELDEDYVDEKERRVQEDERVARLIQEAEEAAARPTEANLKRASQALRSGANRKESTLKLMQMLSVSLADIEQRANALYMSTQALVDLAHDAQDKVFVKDEFDDASAEGKLSLTVSKPDFERMMVVGQFNLGFIVAVRSAQDEEEQDELFIIDQHAADEKYNYERLQRTVTLQSQRLVRPKLLELTAIEEEIILNHSAALKSNGFEIEVSSSTDDDDESTNRHCRLLTLPISGEKTFDVSDLEELLHLLSEAPPGSSEILRPKKVQRMLAMRACRSSIMIGKTLMHRQMVKVVRHMGEMEKPWNCPHGRPTMRHLASLGAWQSWQEGDVVDRNEEMTRPSRLGRDTDWKAWLSKRK